MRKNFTLFIIFSLTLPFQIFAESYPSDTIRKEYVEIHTDDEIIVYPIPITIGQDLKFILPQDIFSSVQVEITDLMGQILLENQVTQIAPFLSNIQLDPGSYLIKISLEERIVVRRIIVSI